MPQQSDNSAPHLTIRTFTDYLTAPGAHQRFAIIQNMKSALGRRRFAPYYAEARSAIRAHHAGDVGALSGAIERLLRARTEESRPAQLAKINNNLRVLMDYADHFAEEPLRHDGGRFQSLTINGVRISAEPTLSGTLPGKRGSIACNVIVDTQADSPTDGEIDYALELLYRGSGLTRKTPPQGAQYWHASSGDAWYLTSPSKRRWSDVQDAAHEIALRWPTIP